MRASGRVHLLLWRLRLYLRRSQSLREAVRRLRALAPDTREHHLRSELRFWRRWLETEGLSWPNDYSARFDPELPVQDHLRRLIDRLPTREIEILDVGAGPLTVIGRRHPSKVLHITATDVLAARYDELLARAERHPPVRAVFAEAERLRERLSDRQFDLVHCQNALDHSADPFAAIEEMIALTKRGGFVVLIHEENEGANELYSALHRWDFSCRKGDFVIAGPGPGRPARNVTELLSSRAEVGCSTERGIVTCTMRKL